jgi:flagellar basal-body rod modification protein FlgD
VSAIDSILTTEQYRTEQANAMYKNGDDDDMLGRDAFLQLFTAQLKNQNPLDPMENEAFVAQLAQFSSVEGIKGMQASLETMVGNLREQSLFRFSTWWASA